MQVRVVIARIRSYNYCKFEKTAHMKKIYLVLGLIASSVSLNAQDFIVMPNDTMIQEITSSTYNVNTINLDHDNSNNDSLLLEWEIIENTIPAGWDYSYCDYTNCYSSNVTDATMTKFGPSQSGFIKVTLSASTAANAVIRFKVYNNGFPENADTLTFIYNSTLGIFDNAPISNVKVYPNPSEGNFTINNIIPNSEVTIVNSLGQTVLNKEVVSTSSTFNSNLNPGVYFVKLASNKKHYATRKLIIR